ncbi:MAG: BCD family MFS transporter [Pseudomonadota bacterium]
MHAPVSPQARMAPKGLSWFAIARIGLVQASLGAMVMLTTTVLNRIMIVEYGLMAAIPAGLVGWHYAVQLSRPIWGHGSDKGANRGLWIFGGLAVLAIGALMAVYATTLAGTSMGLTIALGIVAYAIIGIGVGAGGTSALALLASGVAPERRAAAAAVTWIMMIAGIATSAIITGPFLDPFGPERLIRVASVLVVICLTVTALAVFRIEPRSSIEFEADKTKGAPPDFVTAIKEIFAETAARRFTIFIFVAMMAYNMQDLILEPFAGIVFGMTPGESTSLGGMQNAGALVGMILAGIGGSAFAGRMPVELKHWIAVGCIGAALALGGLAMGAMVGPRWPIHANVMAFGFFAGIFTVAAIGAMMGLAGAGEKTREGVRMGVWGASQAIAFGLGGFVGALGRDVAKQAFGDDGRAFQLVFASEAALFVIAALLAWRATATTAPKPLSNHNQEKEVFV